MTNKDNDSSYWQHTHSRRELLRGSVTVCGVALAGCTGGGDSTDQMEIVVSSKTYTEQRNLGYLAYELLQHNTSNDLVDSTALGSNEAHWNAYQAGEIHAYYDYMGSLLAEHPPKREATTDDPDELHTRLREEMEREYPIQILDRATWENTWAPFARQEAIDGTGIETLSDLAAYVNNGNYDITLAFEEDFKSRADGLENLLDHYKFEDTRVDAWREAGGFKRVVSGPATGFTVEEGAADIGIGYGTSAWLDALDNIVFLDDDRNFWPPFHPVGVVHEDVATESVIAELNKMPAAIPDEETMRKLNARVDIDDEQPQEVVSDHLESEGFI